MPKTNQRDQTFAQAVCRIGSIEQKTMLQNAFRLMPSEQRDRLQLWAFVRDVCCVNSSTARDICHACGWHPDQIGTMVENKK